jgi:hypothetical protein
MQPVRQIGSTVAVTSGGVAAVTTPSSVVLVANASASMAYFTAQSNNTVPAAALGVPIPPNAAVPVAIPGTATYYGAFGAALSVTPVEMMKSQ